MDARARALGAAVLAGVLLASPAPAAAGTAGWETIRAAKACQELNPLTFTFFDVDEAQGGCSGSASSATREGHLLAKASLAAVDSVPSARGRSRAEASVRRFVRIAKPGSRLTFTATFDVKHVQAVVDGGSDLVSRVDLLLGIFPPGCTACFRSTRAVIARAPLPTTDAGKRKLTVVVEDTGGLPAGWYGMEQIVYTQVEGLKSPGSNGMATIDAMATGVTYSRL